MTLIKLKFYYVCLKRFYIFLQKGNPGKQLMNRVSRRVNKISCFCVLFHYSNKVKSKQVRVNVIVKHDYVILVGNIK